eukprot:6192424-Pleurochrysis_carterae.AAC.2
MKGPWRIHGANEQKTWKWIRDAGCASTVDEIQRGITEAELRPSSSSKRRRKRPSLRKRNNFTRRTCTRTEKRAKARKSVREQIRRNSFWQIKM